MTILWKPIMVLDQPTNRTPQWFPCQLRITSISGLVHRFVGKWFTENAPVIKADFTSLLPRFISLYIFSFLSPKDLCAGAQVSWHWKFLTEQVSSGWMQSSLDIRTAQLHKNRKLLYFQARLLMNQHAISSLKKWTKLPWLWTDALLFVSLGCWKHNPPPTSVSPPLS